MILSALIFSWECGRLSVSSFSYSVSLISPKGSIMPSLVTMSQAQWAVLGVSLILLIALLQRMKLQTAMDARHQNGWVALPESGLTRRYKASESIDRFPADLLERFPNTFSDEDYLQIRMFLAGLPDDFAVFLRLAPVRVYFESHGLEPAHSDHVTPHQDFWIQSLYSETVMACYESVFTIPPEHFGEADLDRCCNRQRLVFARPAEDGRDDTILAFIPKYVIR